MSKTVSIKWTKNTYEVALPPTLGEFKAELQTLTNIPIDRQKIVCKGKAITDDGLYSALADKAVIMLIGSAASIQITQTVQNADIQDSIVLPPGLDNLGNTCWLNSSLKAFYSIPELRTALINFSTEHGAQNCKNHVCQHHTAASINSGLPQPTADEINLVVTVGNLYKEVTANIEKSQSGQAFDEAIKPVPLLLNIAKVYPDLFDLTAQQHEQQDVDEFLTYFITTLNKILITHNETDKTNKNLIQELFGIDIEIVTEPACKADDGDNKTNSEDEKTDTTMNDGEGAEKKAAESQKVITFDAWTKLRADVNVDLTDIQGGIKAALREVIEKNVVTGGLTVKTSFNRNNLIISLPKYLLVQLQRFQWKQETQSKAKLIRRVNINQSIDLFPLCSAETQKKIEPFRKTLDSLRAETLAAANGDKMTDLDGPKKEPKQDEKAGYYDLCAIITHQGRSADSGHYVAWTKTNAGSKYEQNMLTGMTEKEKEKWKELQTGKAWIKHDDTKMSFSSDKILTDLAGGGDFHIAYICIYKTQGQ